jgi:hypothetical protein
MTLALLLSGISVIALSDRAAGQAGGTIMLTDGTKMDNFNKVGDADWRVGERAIVANNRRGFLASKQSFDDFWLRAEFYPDEETDSGIFIRCENPQMVSAQLCYEINIHDTNANRKNATGAIVNVIPPERLVQTELHWNVLEFEAKGSQLNVSINGERTWSVRDTKHARGAIALQFANA